MPTAKLTSKGQLTLPAAVRNHLHVGKGDTVMFRIATDGEVVLTREGEDLEALRGILKPTVRGVTLQDMDATIAEGWSTP